MIKYLEQIGLLCFLLLLVACNTITSVRTNPEEDRKARCSLLNKQIIFNGATADQNQAMVERAQSDTLTRQYRADDCMD